MIYLISEGGYSDYGVCFLVECEREVEKSEFRTFWGEAKRRLTSYENTKLERVAEILGVAKQSSMYDYRTLVSAEEIREAYINVSYEFRKETGFFEEVLTENGFSILPFEEYNTDAFTDEF